jgi:hypothetical protein
MLKFYILVSRNMEKVRRHWKYIPKDKLVFVINTLDKEFEKECSQLLHLKKIKYYITESNGTPAKGKNSLLEVFENSNDKYCVQVDGDDFLTPFGVDLYQQVAKSSNPPDVICLRNQIAEILDVKKTKDKGKPETFCNSLFKKKNLDFATLKNQLLQSNFSEEDASIMIEYHKEYYSKGYKYVDPEEAHCRVVFFSKKAAATKFPENMLIGEDTLQYFLLKHEAYLGNLRMVSNDERPATYIYDQTDGKNTVFQEMYYRKNWQWMGDFNKNVREYERQGILHEEELPKLTIDYSSAELDDLGYSGLADFQANENTIVSAPANATQETLAKLYKGEITIALKNSS